MVDSNKAAQVAAWAIGTAESPAALVERFDLDVGPGELEDLLIDWNIEICIYCGYWVDCGDLDEDDDTGDLMCQDCLGIR